MKISKNLNLQNNIYPQTIAIIKAKKCPFGWYELRVAILRATLWII